MSGEPTCNGGEEVAVDWTNGLVLHAEDETWHPLDPVVHEEGYAVSFQGEADRIVREVSARDALVMRRRDRSRITDKENTMAEDASSTFPTLIYEDLTFAMEAGADLRYGKPADGRIAVEQYGDDGMKATVIGYLTFTPTEESPDA